MEKRTNRRPHKRPVKRNASFNLREFISDNLRYILLAAAVVVVIVIIVAVVSGTRKGSGSGSSNSTSATSETAPVTKVSSGTGSTSAGTSDTSTADTSTASTSTSTSSEDTQVISDNVYTAISTYLNSCASGDAAAAEAVCESLDDGTKASIAGLCFPAAYANLVMYLYNGTNSGEYVAVCTFDYTDRGTGSTLPGMSAFYLITVNNEVKMASTATTSANQQIIDEVLGYPEIVELVNETNNAIAAATSSTGSDAAA